MNDEKFLREILCYRLLAALILSENGINKIPLNLIDDSESL